MELGGTRKKPIKPKLNSDVCREGSILVLMDER